MEDIIYTLNISWDITFFNIFLWYIIGQFVVIYRMIRCADTFSQEVVGLSDLLGSAVTFLMLLIVQFSMCLTWPLVLYGTLRGR